ncbi:uncharacterized protein [Lolium perenne]|uniref:uncharacterized protein n=1 Tax=Lolium perenne TaxID=4522 RepID=UPI003A9A24F1
MSGFETPQLDTVLNLTNTGCTIDDAGTEPFIGSNQPQNTPANSTSREMETSLNAGQTNENLKIAGNDQPDDPYGIFEPIVHQTNLEVQGEQAASHEPDEEARLFSEQDVPFESYQLESHPSQATNVVDNDEFIYRNLPTKHHVLRKVPDCIHCGALRFPYEGPAFCCRKGKVSIVTPEVPEELKRLFTSQEDDDAKYFRENIRYFNSHFSFTSLGVTLDRRVSTAARTGVYTFRVSAGLYHALDNLVAAGNGPRHLQLYIYH